MSGETIVPNRTAESIGRGLRARIEEDLAHYGGTLPERVAIAWRGYLAGLIEWGVLTVPVHDRLVRLLPEIPDDPVSVILVGRT